MDCTMARIRSIKPELANSEQVWKCPVDTRYLFVLMWCFCDDDGVHPASHFKLKNEIFPADNYTLQDIQRMVEELKTNDLIDEIIYDNEVYWRVKKFNKHQVINRPSKFRYLKSYPQTLSEYSRMEREREKEKE
jgi:hypothetical protein